MRFGITFTALAFGLVGLLGAQAASSADSDPSSSNSTTAPGVTSPEVAFLQTLQTAQISSMSCLITLVNMTQQNIGKCLNIPALAPLVVAPSTNSSFSTQLDTYLGTACSQTCRDADIAEAQSQLTATCSSQSGTGLITVLRAILQSYTSSYRTLACQVHFNGTAPLCLPSVLNVSQAANNNGFFNSLVSGANLDQYQSVFQSAECTGCTYEMFKAAQYTIPRIRGQALTNLLGSHLHNDCKSSGIMPNWDDVENQEIPPSLQVQQSTGVTNGAVRAAVARTHGRVPLLAGLGLLIGAMI